uniref:Uncharacterized protein n=1 Tax=Oryza punctata TaxID=4537 RepID=A0A0E0MAF5_ORYPU
MLTDNGSIEVIECYRESGSTVKPTECGGRWQLPFPLWRMTTGRKGGSYMYSPQLPSDGNPEADADGALARPCRQLSTASAADSLAVFALAKLIDRTKHHADPQLALAFAICALFQVSTSIMFLFEWDFAICVASLLGGL